MTTKGSEPAAMVAPWLLPDYEGIGETPLWNEADINTLLQRELPPACCSATPAVAKASDITQKEQRPTAVNGLTPYARDVRKGNSANGTLSEAYIGNRLPQDSSANHFGPISSNTATQRELTTELPALDSVPPLPTHNCNSRSRVMDTLSYSHLDAADHGVSETGTPREGPSSSSNGRVCIKVDRDTPTPDAESSSPSMPPAQFPSPSDTRSVRVMPTNDYYRNTSTTPMPNRAEATLRATTGSTVAVPAQLQATTPIRNDHDTMANAGETIVNTNYITSDRAEAPAIHLPTSSPAHGDPGLLRRRMAGQSVAFDREKCSGSETNISDSSSSSSSSIPGVYSARVRRISAQKGQDQKPLITTTRAGNGGFIRGTHRGKTNRAIANNSGEDVGSQPATDVRTIKREPLARAPEAKQRREGSRSCGKSIGSINGRARQGKKRGYTSRSTRVRPQHETRTESLFIQGFAHGSVGRGAQHIWKGHGVKPQTTKGLCMGETDRPAQVGIPKSCTSRDKAGGRTGHAGEDEGCFAPVTPRKGAGATELADGGLVGSSTLYLGCVEKSSHKPPSNPNHTPDQTETSAYNHTYRATSPTSGQSGNSQPRRVSPNIESRSEVSKQGQRIGAVSSVGVVEVPTANGKAVSTATKHPSVHIPLCRVEGVRAADISHPGSTGNVGKGICVKQDGASHRPTGKVAEDSQRAQGIDLCLSDSDEEDSVDAILEQTQALEATDNERDALERTTGECEGSVHPTRDATHGLIFSTHGSTSSTHGSISSTGGCQGSVHTTADGTHGPISSTPHERVQSEGGADVEANLPTTTVDEGSSDALTHKRTVDRKVAIAATHEPGHPNEYARANARRTRQAHSPGLECASGAGFGAQVCASGPLLGHPKTSTNAGSTCDRSAQISQTTDAEAGGLLGDSRMDVVASTQPALHKLHDSTASGNSAEENKDQPHAQPSTLPAENTLTTSGIPDPCTDRAHTESSARAEKNGADVQASGSPVPNSANQGGSSQCNLRCENKRAVVAAQGKAHRLVEQGVPNNSADSHGNGPTQQPLGRARTSVEFTRHTAEKPKQTAKKKGRTRATKRRAVGATTAQPMRSLRSAARSSVRPTPARQSIRTRPPAAHPPVRAHAVKPTERRLSKRVPEVKMTEVGVWDAVDARRCASADSPSENTYLTLDELKRLPLDLSHYPAHRTSLPKIVNLLKVAKDCTLHVPAGLRCSIDSRLRKWVRDSGFSEMSKSVYRNISEGMSHTGSPGGDDNAVVVNTVRCVTADLTGKDPADVTESAIERPADSGGTGNADYTEDANDVEDSRCTDTTASSIAIDTMNRAERRRTDRPSVATVEREMSVVVTGKETSHTSMEPQYNRLEQRCDAESYRRTREEANTTCGMYSTTGDVDDTTEQPHSMAGDSASDAQNPTDVSHNTRSGISTNSGGELCTTSGALHTTGEPQNTACGTGNTTSETQGGLDAADTMATDTHSAAEGIETHNSASDMHKPTDRAQDMVCQSTDTCAPSGLPTEPRPNKRTHPDSTPNQIRNTIASPQLTQSGVPGTAREQRATTDYEVSRTVADPKRRVAEKAAGEKDQIAPEINREEKAAPESGDSTESVGERTDTITSAGQGTSLGMERAGRLELAEPHDVQSAGSDVVLTNEVLDSLVPTVAKANANDDLRVEVATAESITATQSDSVAAGAGTRREPHVDTSSTLTSSESSTRTQSSTNTHLTPRERLQAARQRRWDKLTNPVSIPARRSTPNNTRGQRCEVGANPHITTDIRRTDVRSLAHPDTYLAYLRGEGQMEPKIREASAGHRACPARERRNRGYCSDMDMATNRDAQAQTKGAEDGSSSEYEPTSDESDSWSENKEDSQPGHDSDTVRRTPHNATASNGHCAIATSGQPISMHTRHQREHLRDYRSATDRTHRLTDTHHTTSTHNRHTTTRLAALPQMARAYNNRSTTRACNTQTHTRAGDEPLHSDADSDDESFDSIPRSSRAESRVLSRREASKDVTCRGVKRATSARRLPRLLARQSSVRTASSATKNKRKQLTRQSTSEYTPPSTSDSSSSSSSDGGGGKAMGNTRRRRAYNTASRTTRQRGAEGGLSGAKRDSTKHSVQAEEGAVEEESEIGGSDEQSDSTARGPTTAVWQSELQTRGTKRRRDQADGDSRGQLLRTTSQRRANATTEKEKHSVVSWYEGRTNPLPFDCPQEGCGRRFETLHEVYEHLHAHHCTTAETKPYACELEGCHKRYATRGNLKRHYTTHIGEQPYACTWTGCGMRFAGKPTLFKHMEPNAGMHPYTCTHSGCRRVFQTERHRNLHSENHSAAHLHTCPMCGCGRGFQSAVDFATHLERYHNALPYDGGTGRLKAVEISYGTRPLKAMKMSYGERLARQEIARANA